MYTVPHGGGGGTGVVSLLWFYLNCLLMGSLCVIYWCGLVVFCRWWWEGFLYVCVLIKTSNTGLCISVNISFICKPFFVILYI
jgi:hypothetical protein